MDIARLALQIDVNGAQRARQALRGLQDVSIKATRATDQLAASTMRLNSASRTTRSAFRVQQGAIQQAGFQIGDFAVQVGAGQSALVAFGQQASQLAGVFGPGGAILGAVIAIGSAIAGGFVRGMGEGEDATESLIDTTKELVETLGEATRRQREFINADFQKQILEQERAVRKAEEAIFDANRRLESFSQAAGENVPEAVFEANSAVQALRKTLEDSRLTIDNAEASTNAISKAQEEFWQEVEKASGKVDDQAEKLADLVQRYEAQAETIGMSARETALYEAARLGANKADLQSINNSFDAIEAENRRIESLKSLREQFKITAAEDPLLQRVGAQGRGQDIIEGLRQNAEQVRRGLDEEFAIRQDHKDRVMALDDLLRLNVISDAEERNRLEVESLRRRNEQLAQLEAQKNQIFTEGQTTSLQLTGQFFGNLASIAEKGGKDAFQRYQNLASAQAAIAAALSVASVLGDPTVPALVRIPLAFSIGALAAAQIGEIQNQEYQGSYLGGGYTGTGSRTGGIDGKGGFPAILHPNETVIDHEMGQRSRGGASSTEANVTQVFQLSDNARREAKQQILESAPMIQQMAKQAVLQAINQGGPMSRAVGRRS